jgi:chorismate mutase
MSDRLTIRAIRGAIQIDVDSPDAIREATHELVAAVIERNGLCQDDIVSVFFTTTPDLTSQFPALAARDAGLTDVPLICATEIDVPGAMPKVIRLLAHVESTRPKSQIQHVYLRGAAAMRPDLALAGVTVHFAPFPERINSW